MKGTKKVINFSLDDTAILCGHCGKKVKTIVKVVKYQGERIVTKRYAPPKCLSCGKNPQTSEVKKLVEGKIYGSITVRFNYSYSGNNSNGPVKLKNVKPIRKKQQVYLIIKRTSRTQNIKSDTCFSIGEGTEVLEYK